MGGDGRQLPAGGRQPNALPSRTTCAVYARITRSYTLEGKAKAASPTKSQRFTISVRWWSHLSTACAVTTIAAVVQCDYRQCHPPGWPHGWGNLWPQHKPRGGRGALPRWCWEGRPTVLPTICGSSWPDPLAAAGTQGSHAWDGLVPP